VTRKPSKAVECSCGALADGPCVTSSGRPRATLHASRLPPVPAPPQAGEAVLVDALNGQQVARVLEVGPSLMTVRRWNDRPATWTLPTKIPKSRLVGRPEENDPRLVRAIEAEKQLDDGGHQC
jgi:hypothetical protein